MSKSFTKRCDTSLTGGTSGMYLSQLAFRALAADKRGKVHLVEYRGHLSLREYLEQQGLSYDPELVESYRI